MRTGEPTVLTKTRTSRDSQRRRVYAADKRLGYGHRFSSIEEAQTLLDQIVHSRWWKAQVARSNYQDHQLSYDYPTEVRLRLKTRGKSSSGNAWTATIRLVAQHLCVRVLLHELAHVVTSVHFLPHGPEFCKNYLQIVQRWQGPEQAKALRAAFLAERVRWIGMPSTKGHSKINAAAKE